MGVETLPQLTLDRIFSSDHSWVKILPPERVVTIIATGDVIPARSVNQGMVKRNNFLWPFEKTADVLQSDDLTVINLEAPLIEGCVVTVEGMSFCGDPRVVEGLKFSGVDIATLGNNHVGNYGVKGILETEKHLTDANIAFVENKIFYNKINDMQFAFLSFNDIGADEESQISIKAKEAKENADIVIVSYHWGVEYTDMPSERQIYLAHLAIDNGADLILGNHPHWIQPVEIYKDKLIAYAHGNFVFDQEWSAETKLGVVGKYTFYDKKLVDVEYLPIRIMDYGQPYMLPEAEAKSVLEKMKENSFRIVENAVGQ